MNEPIDVRVKSPLPDPSYIGDGVYVSFDGFHLNIAVNHHRNHVVAIEESVWRELVAYGKRLGWK